MTSVSKCVVSLWFAGGISTSQQWHSSSETVIVTSWAALLYLKVGVKAASCPAVSKQLTALQLHRFDLAFCTGLNKCKNLYARHTYTSPLPASVDCSSNLRSNWRTVGLFGLSTGGDQALPAPGEKQQFFLPLILPLPTWFPFITALSGTGQDAPPCSHVASS